MSAQGPWFFAHLRDRFYPALPPGLHINVWYNYLKLLILCYKLGVRCEPTGNHDKRSFRPIIKPKTKGSLALIVRLPNQHTRALP